MATNGGSRVSRPPQQNGHRTAHSLPRDDHHDPYAPPPSTLAAIANIAADLPSLAASHRQYQACDDEEAPSFRLLLLELSRQGEDPNTAKSYEGLVEYNHKLVYAVVKAVIEPLTRDGAGGVNETVLDKASEGLSVLITTVTETPEVLGYVPKEEGKRVVPIEVPLWLWLFPRVLPLLGRRGCTELDERVEELFHECFTTTARSLRVGYLNGYFMLYLRYCADVALNHLRTSPAGEPLVLPPEGLEEAISHDEHGDLFLEDCTYVLEEQRYVRRHCWYLLHLFVRTALATVKLSTGSSTIQGHAIWVLDGYFLMFELERTQSLVCNVKASELEFYVTAAGAIRSLLISSEQRLPSAALQKGFSILALYCTQLAAESSLLLDKVTEQEFCRCLYEVTAASQQYPAVYQSMQAGLIPACQNLYDSVTRTGLEESLIEMALKPLAHHFDLAVQREPNAHSAQKEGDLAKLSNLGDYLGLYTDDITAERPPNKKRKTGDRDGQLIGIINKLHTLLGLEIHSEAARDLDGLANITSASFDHLDEHHRTDVIRYLGFLPCSSAGFLKVVNDRDQNISGATCEVCVGEQSVKAFHGPIATSAVGIFVALIGSSKFQEYKRLRVMAMIALRSYAMHFNDTRLLDLRESPLGQWCVGSLQSSVRELRIAAGRTLAAFLRESIEDEILQKNRVDVLEFLQLMSESAPAHQEETCIMAWGQIARTLKDLQSCMALERIVQYLGHANQLISSIAFTQILDLAKAKDISVETMLKPHWRTIGPIVVKDLQSRPQIAQLMADLLNISVSELLLNIQADILPWLVLYKKKDVIARIAHARKEDEPGLACIDDANIGPILALLLSQSAPDLEEFALTSLRDITPFFDDLDFQDLLKSGPYSIAVELLKNAGEADDSRKSRVRLALNFLSRRADNGILASQYGKRGHHIGLFLERHILPIMFHFTNLINDTGFAQTSPEEKRRSIKGIEEMLWVGRGYIRSAIPQICAILQSAIGNKDIRPTAFSAWKTMIECLDDEDVGPLLETTFSLVILNWSTFDAATQDAARHLMKHIFDEKRRDVIKGVADVLPSLKGIPDFTDYDNEMQKLRIDNSVRRNYLLFSQRLSHEHESVVTQALHELETYLSQNQAFLQVQAISEQPDDVVGELVRSVLDACVRFNDQNHDIARLSARCVGIIGCLDANRVEAIRPSRDIVVIDNFDDSDEITDFVLFILEELIVKAFLSTKNPRIQSYLSYAMQELLLRCNVTAACLRTRNTLDASDEVYNKWLDLPESVQQTLTPFLRSKYVLQEMRRVETTYPIFASGKKHVEWLRSFVFDLLKEPHSSNALAIFDPLSRIVNKMDDPSVASFLLPYVVLHGVVLGTDEQWQNIQQELLGVLSSELSTTSHTKRTNLKLCSEAVFRVLDYMSRWVQEKQVKMRQRKGYDTRWSHPDEETVPPELGIQRVEALLSSIPAEIISTRAVECEAYSRALFHWEQHIRQARAADATEAEVNPLLERLQKIYSQIDEPDGVDGISAHLHVLDIDQQILGHRKAGRWTAAQSWYEIKLSEEPDNTDVQVNLLHCLKESGQHEVLLNYVERMHKKNQTVQQLLPFAAEASWVTGRWDMLKQYVSLAPQTATGDFNISIGRVLLALLSRHQEDFDKRIAALQEQIACSLSPSTTSTLSACRDQMLKFHVLTELKYMSEPKIEDRQLLFENLERRLAAIGAYLHDKQYLMGIRRAVMQINSPPFQKGDIASAWLTSARLTRKGNSLHQAFNAVLHASQLGDKSATIEHARLLWKEGHQRKAIQSLQGAIDTNAFISHNSNPVDESIIVPTAGKGEQQNLLTARAHLLLAKWLDSAGHTHSTALRAQYQLAAKKHILWEKGHYYLGRHYNKLLESEKALPIEQQSQAYLIGETARLVCDNYLRALGYGTKYIYQTLPRIITLWLDLATQADRPIDSKYGTREFITDIMSRRKGQLNQLHDRLTRYAAKYPAYIFYTALPQIVARITHTNKDVVQLLHTIIVKVVAAHPQQALWTVFAISTSKREARRAQGITIIAALRKKKISGDDGELGRLINAGEKLATQLLLCCEAGDFHSNRTVTASLTKDLQFNVRLNGPNRLCIPVEATLNATLPTLTQDIRTHSPFSRDIVTINGFEDEVVILSSLQKPRKLTARGSDGKRYGLLCKPKDDLRKDQRLMEFNSMINRLLKRDAESSKRRLYIKTYAVTPLNEECGIIEWVDGLRPLRDILLNLYKQNGIQPNYPEIKVLLDEACKSDENLHLFTERLIKDTFPPVFYSWFVQQFPEPSAWFVARLRYTRSAAVMSMVGTILGLGDRHGENILFEEGNGGTFHVDFNCLFDKGLTFAQPEKVPFRLTHNMVDAMGVYGYEGPFRKSSELTLQLLRQHEETLMTILEAFVYDPTLDLLAKKNQRKKHDRLSQSIVPETAHGVLESIRRKLRGLLPGESVPLGVEGQVDELIKQATNPRLLAAMYIGWCAFF